MTQVFKQRYQIVREIARSNDIVYEVTDRVNGGRLALKELNLTASLVGSARRERIERFNREARTSARLRHPNIVSVVDYGEEDGRHFIVMEYLEGRNLRDEMQIRGVFPVSEALAITVQVLNGLQFAHGSQVVHRDIKPDNIHILPGNSCKITDFGIARFSEEPSLTSDGQVFGTPSYMSPEQIEGKEIDARSDLFSLGVVLYEMLAGKKPFTGDSVVAITYAIMHAQPPMMAGLPIELEKAVLHALQKRPDDRPRSAVAMLEEIRAAGAGKASAANYTGNHRIASITSHRPAPWNPSVPGAGIPQQGGPSLLTGPLVRPSPLAGSPPIQAGVFAAGVHQVPGGVPGTSAPPFGLPQLRRPPREAIVIPPELRALSAVAGGTIAVALFLGFAIISLLSEYDEYHLQAMQRRLGILQARAVAQYAARDYTGAARSLDSAMKLHPDAAEVRATLKRNGAFAHVKLARLAAARADLTTARSEYRKALWYVADYVVAHRELAWVDRRLGDSADATTHMLLVKPEGLRAEPPDDLNGSIVDVPVSAPPESADLQPNARHDEAVRLIGEGDEIAKSGDHAAAVQKWLQAAETAPGSDIQSRVQERLSGHS